MKINLKKAASYLLTASMLTAVSGPAYAAPETMEVVLEDVTATESTTLSGEAKVKVSIKGVTGSVAIAQIALKFEGDLEYKSIEFLQGSNSQGNFLYAPNAALANEDGELQPSIINPTDPMVFDEETEGLFILTFAGEAGDEMSISLSSDLSETYCTLGDMNGEDVRAGARASLSGIIASDSDVESKEAVVRLVMNKVTDFAPGDDEDSLGCNVEVTITSETNDRYKIHTVLDNRPINRGGHKESATTPTYTVVNTVLADDTYTVRIEGAGYISYEEEGVTFDEAVEVDNTDFVPGELKLDGVIDSADKGMFNALLIEGTTNYEFNDAADFNRDGMVDKYDYVIYADIPDPAPEETPDSGDEGEDDGESGSGSGSEGSGSGGSGGSGGGGGGGGGSSDGDSSKDDNTSSKDDNTSSKDDGSSSTGTASGIAPTTQEAFTDLGNHAWAKESIYTLKNKGIINGVTATTFAPQNNIKRGDFILILTNMLGMTGDFEENFADVPVGSYYYNAIGRAKLAGIATGDGVNFNPEQSITRQDLISLSYRAFLKEGYIEEAEDASSLEKFTDAAEISEYATAAMASMVKAGIISGADGKVNPKGNATRAEVAVMCAKLLELMN